MTYLSVVVPLNNEEDIVLELATRLKNVLEKIGESYEIILVDDGSLDSTWNILSALAIKESNIKGIKLSRNFGQHRAITAGLEKAIGKWNVVMDGDLQDRPEVIPDLLDEALKGFEIVFVSRKDRPENLLYLFFQSIFYTILNKISGIRMDNAQANYSIISEKVRNAFLSIPEQIRFYSSSINWLGFKRSKIIASHGRRFNGKTSYSIKSRFKLAFDIIFSYSNRPLKLGISLGFIFSATSFVSLLIIIFRYFVFGFTVTGWTSLIIAITFSTGSILLMLGISGLYLGRIFEEVKRRPIFVVEEEINF